MMAKLELALIGTFQVTLDGESVTGFESQKVRALLAYLAVEAERAHSREKLADFLWPDYQSAIARKILRTALCNLRHTIDDQHALPPFLLITHDTLQFNAISDHWLDVNVFQQRIDAGHKLLNAGATPAAHQQLQAAINLYRADFLEDISPHHSPPFEDWLLLKQEYLNRQMLSALQLLATSFEAHGLYEEAQVYVWRQMEIQPWREESHRQMMRLMAMCGQRSAALAQYETCRHLLARELGVKPSAATTALYNRIRGDV
jgi:DNA-binding SARP family transcriptional activator